MAVPPYRRKREDGPFGDGPRCPKLHTQRLRLQMLEPEDEDFLAALDSDLDVMQYIHTGPLTPRRARVFAETAIERAAFAVHLHRWLVLTHDNCRLGWVELSKFRQGHFRNDPGDDVNLGYEFSKQSWGCGYAVEACRAALGYAFERLQCDRIVAYARPDNYRSLRVLEKLGFLKQGSCPDEGRNICGFYVLNAAQFQALPFEK